jgi:hypothetical protein
MSEEIEQAIDEALEGKPRAAELSEMISALELRRQTFQREHDAVTSDEQRKIWLQKLKEVDRQINLLRQEMAITDFVERSVRSASMRPRIDVDSMDDDQ